MEATSATSSTWQEQNQEQDPRFLEVAPSCTTLTSTATATTLAKEQGSAPVDPTAAAAALAKEVEDMESYLGKNTHAHPFFA